MRIVYILEHVYKVLEEEEIRFIGVFSTNENAKQAINDLKNMPGFKKYPLECFQIHECKLDHYEWKEGFINWEEAS